VTNPDQPICVAALYHFAPLDRLEAIRGELEACCRDHAVKGTLLLAREGVNGTIAGTNSAIAAVVDHLRGLPGLAALEPKYSRAETMPFHRLKIRIKAEIVTMGQPHIDPMASAGCYVAPHDWNGLIADPDTIVIDTRNAYEVAIGTFAGAIDPQTSSFREFPEWFRARREDLLGKGKHPRVAMFCTGGIRCEKSTAFLKSEGVEDVYHLQGGILKYLEEVPADQNQWQGECFVFDQRVAVGHGLAPGTHVQCHACRRPVSQAAQQSVDYQEGISCPACIGERSDADRIRYRDRHLQEQIAAVRGTVHIGAKLD
jgi:UPF0176 protein